MNTLDIIILLATGIGLVWGYAKGFFKQLASIVGLLAGLLLAKALYASVGARLAPQLGTSVSVAQVLSFLAIWVLVPVALCLLASLLTKVAESIHLGCVNRLCGAALGLVCSLLWTALLLHVLTYIGCTGTWLSAEQQAASRLYRPMEHATSLLFPALEEATKELLKK